MCNVSNENVVQPFSPRVVLKDGVSLKVLANKKKLYTNMVQSGVYSAEHMKF